MKYAKLFVVESEMKNGKVNTLLFNDGTTLQDAISKYPILNERKIISAKTEECEVIPYDQSGKKYQVLCTDLIVNEKGKIIGKISYSNPNDDELMAITIRDVAEAENDYNTIEFCDLINIR